MQEDGEVSFAARHRVGAAEQAFVRHLDVVGRGAVEGALAAVLDADAGRADKAVGSLDALDRTKPFRRCRQREAVDLAGVEHVGCTGDAALAVIVGDIGIGLGVVLLVEDDERRLLALADLGIRARTTGGRSPRSARCSRCTSAETHRLTMLMPL